MTKSEKHKWNVFSVELFFIIVIVMMCLLAHSVFARTNLVDSLFNPISSLDVAGTYERHSSLIDFLLYIVLFVGIAQSSLAHRFTGRGGRAVVIGVGLVLALSLSSSSFSISKMWPVAAAVFILFTVAIIFRTLRKLIGNTAVSLAISFITAYFIARSVIPELPDELTNLLHGLFYVSVFTLILGVPRTIFSKEDIKLRNLTKKIRKKELSRKAEGFGKEKGVAKILEGITKTEEKESHKIIQDLKIVKSVLEKQGSNQKIRNLVQNKIRDILPKKHGTEIKLSYLKEMTTRMERFDTSFFTKLKDSYNKLSEQQKKDAKKELERELEKLNAEKEIIGQLAPMMEQYNDTMQKYLRGAISQLSIGDLGLALHWINEAIIYEQGIQSLARKTGSLERLIRETTEKEFKSIKQT